MKYLIVGDLHFCEYSSVISDRGERFSKRLENCIQTVEWVESEAEKLSKDDQSPFGAIIYLGDFFDKASLTCEELSAFSTIKWAKDVERVMLVGNHEINSYNLSNSSISIAGLLPNTTIIDKPIRVPAGAGVDFLYLPYIINDTDRDLGNIIANCEIDHPAKRLVVFSHNDLADVFYGKIKSTYGFKLDDIDAHCDLFVNGHIHNYSRINGKVTNVGNITGQNFSEDADEYKHRLFIFNTDDFTFSPYLGNPYAFNFYKVSINTKQDLENVLYKMVDNTIWSIRCHESLLQDLKTALDKVKCYTHYRISVNYDSKAELIEGAISKLNSVDYLNEFKEYCITKLGDSNVVIDELKKVTL